MKNYAVALVCMVAGLPFVVGGCPFFPAAQQIQMLTAADDGTTITGNQGDVLLIALPANHTTLYRWVQTAPETPDDGQSVVTYDQEWYISLATEGLTGEGGLAVLQFSLGYAGTAQLTLELRQSGAPDDEPSADTFSITVQSAG